MSKNLLFIIDNIEVYWNDGNIQFVAGLAIDADGSPRAYGPSGTQPLDYLANAGKTGNWWGIACDIHGKPFIQSDTDPYPGYYVSTTSLQNKEFPTSDPRRYVDSENVPFIVLPKRFMEYNINLGCSVHVVNLENQKSSNAIFADIGPATRLGEGSIALANALGIDSNAKTGGIEKHIIEYTIPMYPEKTKVESQSFWQLLLSFIIKIIQAFKKQ